MITGDKKQQFQDRGVLVFDPGFEEALLDGVARDVEPIYGQPEPPVQVVEGKRIQDAWKISENVKRLATHPPILELLEELYGRKPLPFQTLNFNVGTQQRPHSDTLHFNSKPPGYMCGVWVALEDIDMNNGPLVYYPGSQRFPEITFDDVGVPAQLEQYSKYEDFIEDIIEGRTETLLASKRLEPEYGVVRKGQAILWDANLIHGGSPQRDHSRTRNSQVTHYFFEGTRYWTPMLSSRLFTFWRYPEWIVDDAPTRTRVERARRIGNGLKWKVVRRLRGRLPV